LHFFDQRITLWSYVALFDQFASLDVEEPSSAGGFPKVCSWSRMHNFSC